MRCLGFQLVPGTGGCKQSQQRVCACACRERAPCGGAGTTRCAASCCRWCCPRARAMRSRAACMPCTSRRRSCDVHSSQYVVPEPRSSVCRGLLLAGAAARPSPFNSSLAMGKTGDTCRAHYSVFYKESVADSAPGPFRSAACGCQVRMCQCHSLSLLATAALPFAGARLHIDKHSPRVRVVIPWK